MYLCTFDLSTLYIRLYNEYAASFVLNCPFTLNAFLHFFFTLYVPLFVSVHLYTVYIYNILALCTKYIFTLCVHVDGQCASLNYIVLLLLTEHSSLHCFTFFAQGVPLYTITSSHKVRLFTLFYTADISLH